MHQEGEGIELQLFCRSSVETDKVLAARCSNGKVLADEIDVQSLSKKELTRPLPIRGTTHCRVEFYTTGTGNLVILASSAHVGPHCFAPAERAVCPLWRDTDPPSMSSVSSFRTRSPLYAAPGKSFDLQMSGSMGWNFD